MSEGVIDPRPEDLVAQSRSLRALARRLLRDEHGAEDLVQDTLVVALENGIPAHHRPTAWLSGVLRNLFRMSVRTDARRRRRDESAKPRAPADPAEVAMRLEAQERLLRSVRELPEPYRATLVARFFDDLSAEEIARAEGVPASTVRTRTHRGLALLRERLDHEAGSRRAWVVALLPVARPPASTMAAPAVSAAIAKGAVLMSAKKALALGVVLLALATVGTVVLTDSSPDDPSPPREPRAASADAVADHEESTEAEAAADATLPLPVDLGAADRDLDLFGRLTDREGVPVAGASLEALSYPWRRSNVLNVEGREELVVARATRSARDGTFALRLSRGQLVDLRIRAEGYAETVLPRCQAGERIDAVLTPGAELLVRCADEAGAPVAGVELRLLRSPRSGRPVLERRGSTDERGQALFPKLTPGPVSLLAEHPEHCIPDCRAPDIPDEGRVSFDLVLLAGRTVTGRVTVRATGAPVAGARVGEMWPLRRAVRTDAEGRFAMRGWVDAPWRDLHVVAEGYGRQRRRVPLEGEVEFALDRGDVVTGRVVDHLGGPVVGALVSALASQGANREQEIDVRSCRTGPDGRFRLGSLRRDLGEHTLVVQSRGSGKLLHTFPPAADGPGTVDLGDIVLHPGRAIEGRVVDGDGDPLAGVPVQLGSSGGWGRGGSMYGDREDRRSDDLGRFRFPDLSPGSYGIRVTIPDTGPARRSVQLPEDRDVTDLEIGIPGTTNTDGRTLRVRVVDDTGEPVAGVLISSLARSRSVRTGPDGWASVEGVPRKETWVSALIPPSLDLVAGEPARVGPDEAEVTIRVCRAAVLRGVVMGPDGTPLPGIIVKVAPEGETEAWWFDRTDERGAFAVRASPDIFVDLFVDGSRTGRGDETRLPVRGELRHLTGPCDGLVLRTTSVVTDRKLTIRVLDLEEHPVEGALLSLRARGKTREARTGPEGRVTFADLPSDTVIVWIQPGEAAGLPEIAVDPAPLRVVPDGQEVVARFRRGVLVSGIVLGPDDTPLAGAELKVMGDAGFERRTVTDAGGRFRCPAVPGASHRLWARHQAGDRVLAGILGDVRPDGREVVLRLSK